MAVMTLLSRMKVRLNDCLLQCFVQKVRIAHEILVVSALELGCESICPLEMFDHVLGI